MPSDKRNLLSYFRHRLTVKSLFEVQLHLCIPQNCNTMSDLTFFTYFFQNKTKNKNQDEHKTQERKNLIKSLHERKHNLDLNFNLNENGLTSWFINKKPKHTEQNVSFAFFF